MERAYKKRFVMIKLLGWKTVIFCMYSSMFGNVARTGYHPRMFVSFNKNRYQRLKNKKERKRYTELFEIPIKESKFDTSEAEAADKLVKLLCNKGIVDSFEDLPVEVSGARRWQYYMFRLFSISLYFVSFLSLWVSVIFVDIVKYHGKLH